MELLRNNIEAKFERWTRWVYANRYKTFVFMIVAIVALLSNLPRITIDTSTEGFLHDSDPALIAYNDFRDQFGRDEMVIVAIKPDDVFNIKFLEKLKALHLELEEKTPHLDDITSLINARNTRGEGDELIVEDLLENFPDNDEELAVIKERVLTNPMYKNLLVSEDGKFTTIVMKANAYSSDGPPVDDLAGFDEEVGPTSAEGVSDRKFLTDAENTEMVTAVRDVIARYDGPDFPITIAGSPVFVNDLKKSMMRDMRKFMLMAIAAISILLFVMFRKVSGVAMPMFIVILSLLSTVAIMAIAGTSIKLPTQILPSFLLAVGVGDSVHILAIFYYRLQKGDNKEDAIVYAMGHSGLAILMTSLTTAAGLGSFATAKVAPISDLGIYASAGVMIALLYTITLLPALISIFPISAKAETRGRAKHEYLDDILASIASFSTSRPKLIIAISGLIMITSAILATNVRFSHNPISWLPESFAIKHATELIDKELKGTVSVEVIIDTGKENGLYDPEVLAKLDRLATDLETYHKGELFIGKAWTISTILKEIHKALNENRQEFYAVPKDKNLIAQEFLLFENSGSDDLEDVVDSQFRKVRFTLKAPWLDAMLYEGFVNDIRAKFDAEFGKSVDILITGMVPLLGRTIYAAMVSAATSYTIAGVVITLMMILLLGNLKLGLISMIPNIFPIVLIIGIMGYFDMPMDMFTMLVGSIAIGLAVDDTVHFMHNFRRYYGQTKDVAEATKMTLHTTGRAMLVTSVVLSAGFFIYMFAAMNNIFNFGLLTGTAIVAALLADYFLAPALLMIVYGDAPESA